MLIFELFFDLKRGFLNGENVVALVLVGQNAVDAELLTALLAIGLNRLHICYMSIAKLSDQAELIHKWFVNVHVQKTVLVRLMQIQKLTRTTGH